MPPDSFFAGRSANGASPVLSSSSAIRHVALGTGLPEQAAEKFDVLADAEVGIEVLAEALRHVGDPRTDRCPVPRIRHIAAEHGDAAGLNLPRAGDDAEQCRFADAVGTDQPDHAVGRYLDRDAIERADLAVTLRDAVEARDGSAAVVHGAPCSFCGQTTVRIGAHIGNPGSPLRTDCA